MCRQLDRYMRDRVVEDVVVLRGADRYRVGASLVGKQVVAVWRVGKVIYLGLDRTYEAVRCHLAMSGFWSCRQHPWTFDYVEGSRDASDESHVRVVFHMSGPGGPREMLFHDQRLFGRMEVVTPELKREPGNGHEYIRGSFGILPEVGAADFFILVRTYGSKPVRTFLCDQDEVPGVGNIYAAEALYHARIHPLRPCDSLSYAEAARLRNNVRREFTDAMARELDYSKLRVYRQDDCWHCQSKIQTVKVDGRTVYFCPTCQTPYEPEGT